MKNKIYYIAIVFAALLTLVGCEKFLDEKTVKSYTVPSTLGDLQALLDNQSFMVERDASAGEVSSGDYYLTDAVWTALSLENYRRMYLWEKTFIFQSSSNEWNEMYRAVNITNEVLTDLPKIGKQDQESTWNNITGQAYFHRGRLFYQIVSLWTKAYDAQTAATDLGVPLRLNSNFNEQSVRASVAESYNQVISDLKMAIINLPSVTSTAFRPSKAGAYGMLARVYLSIRDYNHAGLYADSCLQLRSTLLNYNSINSSATYPFSRVNTEVVSESYAPVPTPVSPTRARILEDIYAMYSANDLRKIVFFKTNTDKSYAFKGGYEGTSGLFTGVAVDEMYLIRAECFARNGKTSECLKDLNTLLVTRYKTGTYVPLNVTTAEQAMDLVLTERRKELLMRCLRWTDLKRLNKEGMGITMMRVLKGATYTLPPNDSRYALAIPEDVIQLSGISQNP
ncbi:hypothetical protein AB669_03645 [Pedobacter sp. BMA]|nr:hypothetical protein AB669_03645 [Pedobacter sp. BMA]